MALDGGLAYAAYAWVGILLAYLGAHSGLAMLEIECDSSRLCALVACIYLGVALAWVHPR